MPTNDSKYMNEYMKKYRDSAKTVECTDCGRSFKSCYRAIHNKSQFHVAAVEKKTGGGHDDEETSFMKELAEVKQQLHEVKQLVKAFNKLAP